MVTVQKMQPTDMDMSGEGAEPGARHSNTRLAVYNVPDSLTEETFIALFSIYGYVRSARIFPGISSGCAVGVVQYCTEEAAKAARLGLDGFELHDGKIRVVQADAHYEKWRRPFQPVNGSVNRFWSRRDTRGKPTLRNVMPQDEASKESEAFTQLPSPAISGLADVHGKRWAHTSNKKSPPPQVQQTKTVIPSMVFPCFPSKEVSLDPMNLSASSPIPFVYNNEVQYVLLPNVYSVCPRSFGFVSQPSSGQVFYAVPLFTNVAFSRLSVWPRYPQNLCVSSAPSANWPPVQQLSMCRNIRSRLPGWMASAVPV